MLWYNLYPGYKYHGKEITIKYPHHWTPLDPNNKIKHLSKLYFEDEVIFSEVEGL